MRFFKSVFTDFQKVKQLRMKEHKKNMYPRFKLSLHIKQVHTFKKETNDKLNEQVGSKQRQNIKTEGSYNHSKWKGTGTLKVSQCMLVHVFRHFKEEKLHWNAWYFIILMYCCRKHHQKHGTDLQDFYNLSKQFFSVLFFWTILTILLKRYIH